MEQPPTNAYEDFMLRVVNTNLPGLTGAINVFINQGRVSELEYLYDWLQDARGFTNEWIIYGLYGNYFLEKCIRQRRTEFVECFIHRFDIKLDQVYDRDGNEMTTFQMACRYGTPEIVKAMLSKRDTFDINKPGKYQMTTTFTYACFNIDERVPLMLLDVPGLDITPHSRTTPLHVAFRMSHKELAKKLLRVGYEKYLHRRWSGVEFAHYFEHGETALGVAKRVSGDDYVREIEMYVLSRKLRVRILKWKGAMKEAMEMMGGPRMTSRIDSVKQILSIS